MFKKIRNILKKNKDYSLLFNDLKKVRGNDNYLEYILNFKQHIINPKEDVEERTYDIINYLRNSKEIISNIGEKKIKNGSTILSDNSSIVNEILNKAKSKGKKFDIHEVKQELIEKADVILVGEEVNPRIFKLAQIHDVPVFLCTNSLKKKKKKYTNFTGVISELGIYKPNIFEEIKSK